MTESDINYTSFVVKTNSKSKSKNTYTGRQLHQFWKPLRSTSDTYVWMSCRCCSDEDAKSRSEDVKLSGSAGFELN